MALSKRKLKQRHIKTFNHCRGHLAFLIRGNDLASQIQIQIDHKRMRSKFIQTIDYENIEPFFGSRWSCPIVYNNPVKRSRVKNYINSYRMEKAENVKQPNGVILDHNSLMNLYLSKDRVKK